MHTAFKEKMYDLGKCHIHHYNTGNNGVVLIETGVIAFVEGEFLRINKNTSKEEVLTRATPFFETLVKVHNSAFEKGVGEGADMARTEIRNAIVNALGLK